MCISIVKLCRLLEQDISLINVPKAGAIKLCAVKSPVMIIHEGGECKKLIARYIIIHTI